MYTGTLEIDGSVVRRTGCFSIGPQFNSQQFLIPTWFLTTPLSVTSGMQVDTDTHAGKALMQIKAKLFFKYAFNFFKFFILPLSLKCAVLQTFVKIFATNVSAALLKMPLIF